ncbi:hypothetical protein L195_g000682 [Trifolium pratense]|uniref:Uncharacterized protein n=1 Tax=Trifolium pratense TaxID=57577 RepID=A0A2K3NMK0_TRIPR|nr:hypothetical protein L195_g000682 [Trifolium pratense]
MVPPAGLSTESQCEMEMEESYNFMDEWLPEFVGEDPMGWIVTAERIIDEQKIYSSDKVQWAFMRMEGVAMIGLSSGANCNESMTEFDVAPKKIEADRTRISVTESHTMVVDTPQPSGSSVKELPKPKPPDRDAS